MAHIPYSKTQCEAALNVRREIYVERRVLVRSFMICLDSSYPNASYAHKLGVVAAAKEIISETKYYGVAEAHRTRTIKIRSKFPFVL